MGKKTKEPTAEEDEPKSRSKLIVVFGAVALVAVGAFVGSKVLGGSTDAASAGEPTTTTTEPDGPITTLDSITVNLADGRFLKLGLAFEVHHDEDYPPEANPADTLTKGFAREVDASIMVLSTFTYEQLVAPDGKATAKHALLERLVQVSDGAIRNVLFHEFVMQ